MSGVIRTFLTCSGELARDVLFAVRSLRKSPGFTLAAIGCLSLGIGATAAMYSQIQATVFRAVPGVSNPENLVRLQQPVSYPEFDQLSEYFDRSAAFLAPVPFLIAAGDGRPQRVWGQLVSPDYFETLGVQPILGRTYSREDGTFGAARVCVISHRLWQSRFGGAADVVGRSVTVNGVGLTIAGVAPEGFAGSSPATSASDIWAPVTANPAVAPELLDLHNPRFRTFTVLGRLPGTLNREQAELALDAALRRIRSKQISDPASTNQKLAVLLPAGNVFPVRREDLPRAIGFPLVLVGLVLIMACGNVSHLVLARQLGRRRELAVRISLGAGKARIMQICLAETAVLSLAGAAGGLLLALWFLSFVRAASQSLPGYIQVEGALQWTSLAASVGVASLAAFLSGLPAAVQAIRFDPYQGLKTRGAVGTSSSWFGIQNVVVFQQVAASMVLLLLTSFVVFGWYKAAGRDLGYDPRGVYLIRIDPARNGLSPEQSGQVLQRITERLRGESWVEGSSIAYSMPVSMSSGDMMMAAKVDFADGTKALPSIRADVVGHGFFRNLGVRVVQGREFTADDEKSGARVIIVNQTMARQSWPAGQAVGQTLRLDNEIWEVIGVTGDIKSAFLLSPDLPAVYRPVHAGALRTPTRNGVTILIRSLTQGDIPSRVTRLLERTAPEVRGIDVAPISKEIELAAFFTRFALFVYGGMGVFGLLLACAGLAGVTAHAVARRTAEIGVRTALGATRSDILRLIVGRSAVIVALGAGAGMLAALGILRLLASFIESFADIAGFSASDPVILIGAPLFLSVVALLAASLPALKALRIEASSALRLE